MYLAMTTGTTLDSDVIFGYIKLTQHCAPQIVEMGRPISEAMLKDGLNTKESKCCLNYFILNYLFHLLK